MMKKRYRAVIALIIVIAIAIISGNEYMFIKDTNKFNMTGQVIRVTGENTKIGFAAQTTELNFGRLPVGGRSTKFIDVSNKFSSPAKIKAVMHGDIVQFVDLSEDEMNLGPFENRQLKITFNSEETGNYTGEIEIVSYLPKYDNVNWLLKYK